MIKAPTLVVQGVDLMVKTQRVGFVCSPKYLKDEKSPKRV